MHPKNIIGAARIFWRDLIMRASDATLIFDELMAGYFFADTAYQYTWSKLEVHQTMLEDEVRVNAFEKAIREKVKPGDRVLDVGTGTGILALLAAKAGATEVVGVDSANIIEVAKKAAEKTAITNVKFIRSDIRDLKIDPVDCLICELIGLYITDEGIMQKVANALKHLKPSGTLIPEKIDVFVVPVQSERAGIGFWKKRYGIDYSAVEEVSDAIRNCDMTGSKLLSEPVKAFTIDLKGKENTRLNFDYAFKMSCDCEFHGCVMYFEAKLSDTTTISTDPRKPLTHWKQIFLPNKTRVTMKKGETLGVFLKSVFNNTKWKWKYSFN